MRLRPTPTLLWLSAFPFLFAGVGLAMWGVGTGVLCLVIGGITCLFAARRVRARAGDATSSRAGGGATDRFARWFQFSIIVLALGVLGVFVSSGTRAGIIALSWAALAIIGGAITLVLMRYSHKP